jgi:hypothetical protein
MVLIVLVFALFIVFDMRKFVRIKVPAKVYVLYFAIVTASLVVSLFLASGKRPYSPAKVIEAAIKFIGIEK